VIAAEALACGHGAFAQRVSAAGLASALVRRLHHRVTSLDSASTLARRGSFAARLLSPRAMTAGYSGTPLVKKLGLAPGMRALVLGWSGDYDALLGGLPERVTIASALRGRYDFIHLFTAARDGLERQLPALKAALESNGTLWISWPKKSARVASDLDENVVRAIGLGNGLVDVKVCAVDAVWSGLKFVYRLKDR
jgi:hypothetical protein